MKDFAKELTAFLDSETGDMCIGYDISHIDDDGIINVTTWVYGDSERYIKEDTKNTTYWRWNNEKIEIEVGEDTDCWEEVNDYDWCVKYFWMMVSPYLFRVK